MSSKGPNMVERRYGLAGNGLKWPEKSKKFSVTHGGYRRRFPGPIRARPMAAGREISPA